MGESSREIVSFRFVRACVRSCAWSGCLGGFDAKNMDLPFPFSLMDWGVFPLPFPHPQTSYPSLAGLIGIGENILKGCWVPRAGVVVGRGVRGVVGIP